MNCRDFLVRHSEYVDGAIDSPSASMMSEHARACSSCGRYDQVVRRGGELVREFLPVVEVSEDFESRMRHRLYHVRDDMARGRCGFAPVHAAVAAVVLTLGAAGALAVGLGRTPVVDSQVVFAEAPRSWTPIQASTLATTRAPALPPVRSDDDDPVAPGPVERDVATPVAAPAAWPVYSRGAAAVAFPASKPSVVARPTDFRPAATHYPVGALLIRY